MSVAHVTGFNVEIKAGVAFLSSLSGKALKPSDLVPYEPAVRSSIPTGRVVGPDRLTVDTALK